MPFTVTREGGMDDIDFDVYAATMNRWNLDVADTLRTPEPGSRARWLPVWQDRTDAEHFARDLKREDRKAWHVFAVDNANVSRGPLGPVDIYVTPHSDGCVYGLDPYSGRLIRKRFPNTRLVHTISIRSEMKPDFRTAQGHLWDQVARMLTGLTDEQLAELGGYRLYDPRSKEFARQAKLPGERAAG